ncbi:phosphate-selective porin O/P [Thiogranum longum]|uniref:Phosphate-selective porin O/P n=1 Tax=Thiogranum longum TaxID=1537524 RepID=A0A4R1HCP4_9GAMM|nr:porin [Thiogranum longum]TCK18333.1 phosphate-selective porin O/P [Thiogranum longum]
MKQTLMKLKPLALALCVASLPLPAYSADNLDSLRNTVETLKKQLEQVQKQLDEQDKATVTRADLEEVRKEAASANEWKSPNTLVHMAGYADVGYAKTEGEDGSFGVGGFSPIFHFQYRDLVMLESELEFEVEDDGETSVALEYLTIDFFLNDYVTLVAGKFLSPIGQFRQNLHPSWINKIVSAPPGFGHDGAAPTSELGAQLRGGFPLGGMRTNFAVYAGNGPELNSETEDQVEFELEGVRAEGFGTDADEELVYGGRFGLLPIPSLEIGVSGVTGKATVTELEDESGLPELVLDEEKRDYRVYGADFNFSYRSLGVRGEYVKTRVGSANTGITASGSATWESWYTQAAYKFLPTKWEGVVRYTDFDSAVDAQDVQQWAFGVNYLFTSNFMAKFTYELNDGENGSPVDDNRFLTQLAYGF